MRYGQHTQVNPLSTALVGTLSHHRHMHHTQTVERATVATLTALSVDAARPTENAAAVVKGRGSVALDISLEPVLALLRGSGPLLAMAAARRRPKPVVDGTQPTRRGVVVDVALENCKVAMRIAHDVHIAVAVDSMQACRMGWMLNMCMNGITTYIAVDHALTVH